MSGDVLTERERRVLEAVIRTYVETAEPAGSRVVAKKYALGVSPATVRNTMADLEEKGFLYHPHASAGRVPTDRAYRYYVDSIMRPVRLTAAEQRRLRREIGDEEAAGAPLEWLIRRATQALGLLTGELGVAIAPRLDETVLEKLELVSVASDKVLLVLTLGSGRIRTVYVDLPSSVPPETLVSVTMVLNERLAGLTLAQVRQTLPERLRDSAALDDASATELLNVFLQAAEDVFDKTGADALHLGNASVLANQPEFSSGSSLKGLIELTERRELLASVLGDRVGTPSVHITIGGENADPMLTPFTLVTSPYRSGSLSGVIGVIGPTRMSYEKVAAIVRYTSLLLSELMGGEVDAPDHTVVA
ncbi:MAG: heat-inducible transcriptional repressor HrcA [bacterium]|jgi:heat-inducible transcriptional repressor|nr:MAG: heat-inducible transcription repressor HrcA [bacterium]